MRTGRYRFETHYTQRKWFVPARAVQVLMVEHEEPIDQNQRGRVWRAATLTDAMNFENEQVARRVDAELMADKVQRLQGRLEAISIEAARP